MKTATIPSLRVEPELREAAESVLRDGETLSSFVEASIRRQVDYRKTQAQFIAHGLLGLDEAERTGTYYTSEDIVSLLDTKIEKARASKAVRSA